ncbi:hypothetical protein NV226_01530 [Mycoplasma iguanae]|uniref:DNA methylase adenine-specific domain-containing protein n=1 Tax=Mycoplasma iguanae TaxID=292461 RepID=A0ABY5RB22_9MOLU|nr:hypothetical protein [Mycoplasma iguanae]UVD81969.1 hypothetical protein NV226_01530 [Mycoplasma iguanae]
MGQNPPRYTYLVDINNRNCIKIDNLNFSILNEFNWKSPKEFVIYDEYIEGWIDEYSIVGWNNTYCTYKSNATKEDVKNELINPKILNIKKFDWNKQLDFEKTNRTDNNWLTFNMNLLGSSLLKKQLGAFFTPDKYVKISTQLVREAIENVPKGNDYIILDRCAGTGNLQKFLSEDELSHCVLNTYDYTEWTTLKGLYEGRVRMIIPPTNKLRNENGLLENGNALSKNFIDYRPLEDIIANKKITIIILENPPFRNITDNKISKDENDIYIKTIMGTQKAGFKTDLSNLFIWSAVNKYLRQKGDAMVLYSPIKYWKSYNVVDTLKFEKGYIVNKKDFNASSESAVSLIHWSWNYLKNNYSKLNFEIIDHNIDKKDKNYEIKKVFNTPAHLFNKIKQSEKEKIAILNISGFSLDYQSSSIYINDKDVKGNGSPTILYKNNFIEYLPLFAAKKYKSVITNWWENETIFATGDGGFDYKNDKEFLKNCLIWTCLTDLNKARGDELNPNPFGLMQDTISNKILYDFDWNDDDKKILELWKIVLSEAKKTSLYKENKIYSLNDINNEINIKKEDGKTKTGKVIMVPKYHQLDYQISNLKNNLKEYYKSKIVPNLFKYELLK